MCPRWTRQWKQHLGRERKKNVYPLDLCTTKRNLIRKSRYFVAFRVKIALLMKLNLYVRHDVQAFISHKYNIKILPFISMLGRLFLLYILFFSALFKFESHHECIHTFIYMHRLLLKYVWWIRMRAQMRHDNKTAL